MPSNLSYKTHLSRQQHSWSLKRSWSIDCQRCTNCICILDLTAGFTVSGKDNRKTGRESFKFWDLVRLILDLTVCKIDEYQTSTKHNTVRIVCMLLGICSLIARFMGPTWGPPGADRTQVGPMLAPWTLLSGMGSIDCHRITYLAQAKSLRLMHILMPIKCLWDRRRYWEADTLASMLESLDNIPTV